MTPSIQPKDATLGAVVTDVDLAHLNDATWAIVENAFSEYGVLIFPGQHLTDEEQVAFASRFGDLEIVLSPISNAGSDNTVVGDDELRYWILRGNEQWHIDSSFKPLSAKASCLTAVTVPAAGGDTQWADMRAGYDALDDQTRRRIEGLCALHSIHYSHEKLGQPRYTGGEYGFHVHGAPLRPLVKTHPVTRRKSLFIGRHAYGIPGLDPAASERLLDELLEFACRPPRILSHRWDPGDLVVWDNRRVLHRARPFDRSRPRVMRHTRVSGDPATELAGAGV
jgi:alpha-ketoglutarate-dependent taurine dioxygenase